MLFGREFVTIASPPASARALRLKNVVTASLFVISCVVSNAQNPDTLTNETIIRMVASGVPTATVIKTIQVADSVNFRFLPGDIQQLSQYKVPDDVFKAMATRDKLGNRPPPVDTPVQATRAATSTQLPVKSSQPATAQTNPSCTYFTVVTKDKLDNIKQGLSADDVNWFQKSFAKKYPNVCYADPAETVPIVFYITVTPDVYHGTRVVNQTSTHSDPVSGTITDDGGNTARVSGTVETTSTSSTAVPYSVEYGIFTLSVERRKNDGQFDVVHRFQQKGLYRVLYGIPLGGRGHHPVHAVIEDAAKWVNSGGLTDPRQSALPRTAPIH